MGGHVQHFDAEGHKTPSVSQIPGIFAKDMSGFHMWICSQVHGKDTSKCCVNAADNFYKESANLGHDIHNLREAFLNGEKFEEGVPEYQARVFEPVAAFYKSSGYRPLQFEDGTIGVELKMTGKEFGGTLDGVGCFEKPFWEEQRKTFWDLKTRKYFSSYIGKDVLPVPSKEAIWIEDLKIKSKLDILHPLQLYGYSVLLKEVHNVEANWGLIIRREKNLDKRPEIQLRGYYLPAYKAEWDASLLMWRFING